MHILIAPAAFEERTFNKVSLSAHSQFFNYPDRRPIEDIERRNHAMFSKGSKNITKKTPNCFGSKPLALILRSHYITDPGLLWITGLDHQGAVSDMLTFFLVLDGKLEPLSRHRRMDLIHLFQKCSSVVYRVI